MHDIILYKKSASTIKAIHNSGITLKILLLLNAGKQNISDLQTGIKRNPASILTKINHLKDMGLIKGRKNYSLTNSGRIVTIKIVELVRTYAVINHQGDGNESIPPNNMDSNLDSQSTVNCLELYLKNKNCIQTIHRSTLIIQIMLALINGGKTRSQLRDITGSGSPALTPKINWMLNGDLIQESGYEYTLTPNGKILAHKTREFIRVISMFDRHKDYWNSHSLENLPEYAISTIHELYEIVLVQDTAENPFKNYQNWMRIITDAEYVHSISNYVIPSLADALSTRFIEGLPGEVILTSEVAKKLFQEPYTRYTKDLESYPNLRMLVADVPDSFSFTVTDKCFTIKFNMKNNSLFDSSQGLVSSSEEARAWGEQLFNHHKKQSVPIMEYLKNENPQS